MSQGIFAGSGLTDQDIAEVVERLRHDQKVGTDKPVWAVFRRPRALIDATRLLVVTGHGLLMLDKRSDVIAEQAHEHLISAAVEGEEVVLHYDHVRIGGLEMPEGIPLRYKLGRQDSTALVQQMLAASEDIRAVRTADADKAAVEHAEKYGTGEPMPFGRSTVTVYSKGFVQVDGEAVETLYSIDLVDASIGKAAATGRSFRDGSVLLSIATDAGVHQLEATEGLGASLASDIFFSNHTGWYDAAIKQGHRLVAAGKAAAARQQLDQQRNSGGPSAGIGGVDLAGQLAQLAQLKDAGVLTDDEFVAAKQRLLGG